MQGKPIEHDPLLREMATAVQAPRTVGPNLAAMTVRELAARAWASKSAEDRYKAERAALKLATAIFGSTAAAAAIVFDDFVPTDFAKRHRYEPHHLVTFEVEGLEFNYVEASGKYHECLMLIDRCPCGRGPRQLASIRELSDLGRAWEWDYSNRTCIDCEDDKKKLAT